jgi:hypothetical protein
MFASRVHIAFTAVSPEGGIAEWGAVLHVATARSKLWTTPRLEIYGRTVPVGGRLPQLVAPCSPTTPQRALSARL